MNTSAKTCPACGKTVTIRKDGRFRKHVSAQPEWPGSPFKKRCSRSGAIAAIPADAR